MFQNQDFRMPRTVRRPLSATAMRNLDMLADRLDRSGANSCSHVGGASNDELREEIGSRMIARRRAA